MAGVTPPWEQAHGAEGGISDHKGNLAAGREARGHAGTVLLGDAHVQVLLGQLFAEIAGLAALADLGVYHEDILIFFAQGDDLVAEAVAGGDLLLKIHLYALLT